MLNLLELLASAVTIYMNILQMVQGSHILAFTDSYSALGWMHKEFFYPVNSESHDAVARWIEWTLFSNEIFLYLQHIKGTGNIIADSLSRDFLRSDQTLTKNFNQILPPQTEASFHIKQPPRNVISWISLLAAASTLPTASPKPLQPISLETGTCGAHSSNIQATQTNSWGGSQKSRGKSLCHHSPPQYEETSSAQPGNKYSSTEMSSPPYHMYLSPPGRTLGATRPYSPQIKHPYSYR